MKRVLSIVMLALLLCVMLVPAALANQDAIRNSVVRVYAEGVNVDGSPTGWIGTAFAVGKPGQPVKHFVTNAHVASGANKISLIFEYSSQMIPCNVLAISERCDLAVLELESPTKEREAAILRPFDIDTFSNKTESVWAYGHPSISMMLEQGTGDQLVANSRTLTVTDGTISKVASNSTTYGGEIIQHTASLSGGNSGGPLVDKDGYVLGVNSSGISESDADNHDSVFFAVSANEVKRFLEDERVPFATPNDLKSKTVMYVAIGAAAVAIIGLVLFLVLRNKNKGGNRVLVGEAGDLTGKTFQLKAKTTVGRVSGGCNVAFPEGAKGISAVHCTITFENGVVKVCDENSSYGTWIDNTRLQPGQPAVMHRGQRLYLGSKKQALSLR